MGLHKICMMYPQKKPPHRRHFLSFFQNLHWGHLGYVHNMPLTYSILMMVTAGLSTVLLTTTSVLWQQ
jgi:hypothetical protein